MAEILVGDVVARLRADTTDWTRGLQTAMQQLQAFQQTLTGMQGPLTAFQQTLPRGAQQATQSLQQLNQTLAQTGTALSQARTQAEGFGSAWRTALSVAGGIGLATSIAGIVGALKDFAVSTVEVGARMESLRNSFSALAGSQVQGRQEFDQLFQTAQRLGIAFEPLARGFRQLTAAATQAGVPLQEQMRLMTALATEARRVGISNEEMGRSVTAVAQIFSKGKVSMEELRQQLGEALPTAIAAFARGMGRSVEEVEKLVEAGVSATRAGAALTRGFEAMQREGGQVAEGLQQAFNRFGNEVLRSKDLLTATIGPLSQVIGLGATYLKQVNDLVAARRLLSETLGQEARLGVGLKEGDLARLPEAQQRRLKEVQDLIAQQGQEGLLPGTTLPAAMREANLTILRQEQAAILAQAVALKEQRREQEQATAAEARATDQRKQQAETIADLTKQMEALRKVQEDYRRRAALTPELLGRPGGTLEEQAVFQKGLQGEMRPGLEKLAQAAASLPQGVTLPADIQAQVRAFDTGYGLLGNALDAIKDKQQAATKATREAEQARVKDLREQEQEQKQRIQGIARDLDIFGLTRSPEEEADLKAQAKAQHERMQEFARGLDIFGLELSPEQERQRRVTTAFDQRLQSALDQQEATRAARPEARLRAEAGRQGLTLTPEQEGQLARLTALRQEQERLTEATRLYNEVADAVGHSWTSALTSIADHTKTVSAAFRDMAHSIVQSLAQTAASEGWRQLISIGAGLLTSALGGGNTATASQAAGTIAGFRAQGFAEGGMVTRPTFAMLGENPATRPEIVMNRQQMQQFIASATRAAPTAGGQAAGGISIMNFPNKDAAEHEAANQRAMGREVILNAVMSDLSQGSGSQIHRALSTLQR